MEHKTLFVMGSVMTAEPSSSNILLITCVTIGAVGLTCITIGLVGFWRPEYFGPLFLPTLFYTQKTVTLNKPHAFRISSESPLPPLSAIKKPSLIPESMPATRRFLEHTETGWPSACEANIPQRLTALLYYQIRTGSKDLTLRIAIELASLEQPVYARITHPKTGIELLWNVFCLIHHDHNHNHRRLDRTQYEISNYLHALVAEKPYILDDDGQELLKLLGKRAYELFTLVGGTVV